MHVLTVEEGGRVGTRGVILRALVLSWLPQTPAPITRASNLWIDN